MAWEDLPPPAKSGKGENVTIATWKRGGLGVVLSPELAARLKVSKGSKARVAINVAGKQLRITLDKAGKHAFSVLKGAALIRLGTIAGVLIHSGKHSVDWTETNTADGLALTIDLPDHKPKAEAEERAAPPPPRSTAPMLPSHPARSVPSSLQPRDAKGRPIVPRSQDPRYQVPG